MSERPITFFFRGQTQQVQGVSPVMTVLQFLREHGLAQQGRQTGTKEGCAEGDCGACTVVIGELVDQQLQLRSVNACIHFLPTLDGKALFTVEDLKQLSMSEDQSLHPVQQAMVELHGSQCGFCTPGFIMSLWAMYENEPNTPSKETVHDYLSGNLCRCTGYRPILDAAQKAYDYPTIRLARQNIIEVLKQLQQLPALEFRHASAQFFAPKSLDAFADLRVQYPQARLVAGSTDVGLWVTKQGRQLGDMLYIGQVEALKHVNLQEGQLRIGANVTLTDALTHISTIYPELAELQRRFASMPIKNAGTLGGNIANGSPIGDSMPVLMTLNTRLRLRCGQQTREIALEDFYLDYQKTDLQQGEFVEAILVPVRAKDSALKVATYKISKRFEQDISAVCAALSCELDEYHVVQSIKIAFGGMAAIPKRAVHTEAVLLGQPFDMALLREAQVAMEQDYQPLNDGRASAAYRLQVAKNCLERFFVEHIHPQSITRSDNLITMGEAYKMNHSIDLNPRQRSAKAGQSIAHESAHLHVTGEAVYIDDMPELANTLHLAVGFSKCAKGKITAFDLEAVRAAQGVYAVYTAADIQIENNWGPIVKDDPIFADGEVEFYGQALFVVAADTYQHARQAVRLAKIEYAAETPILSIQDAIEQQSWVLPPVEFSHGEVDAAFEHAPHRLSGSIDLGGQEHFYLEGQISYAVPLEDQSLKVYCSTQHPTEMQLLICHALGLHMHQVSVEARRMGGGFGGKESQSAQWACIASLAAQHSGRPCKLRLDRDDDMTSTGKRHGFAYEWSVAFDQDGLLHGLKVQLASNCGFSADLSGPVNERAICHLGNAYYLNAVQIRNLRCKTNTVSNTAYRGFGGPQGMFVIENILDDIARYLNCDPVHIRQKNFFAEKPGQGRDRMHYGAEVRDNVAPKIVEELLVSSRYFERKAEIEQFNRDNTIIKRGLALTPLMFGISFNAVHYNQAGALVYVYMDGTVAITHGGTEMGQGLYTKVRQVAAHELGLSIEKVRLIATDTSRVPNTSATAASSGADLNGKAVQNACIKIRERLSQLAAEISQTEASTVHFENNTVSTQSGLSWPFDELVHRAYMARVQLWDSGFYKTPEIHYDQVNHLGRPFFYYAYGAAASEVAIDTLTGEMKVLRADILHDVGRSINPAIDIGQIEGGFIQGMGWLTTEELCWQPQGPHAGRLFTHAPSTYKIPTSLDIPPVFHVKLFDNSNEVDTIYRSKAVGEPPFMLGLSVFSAIRQAVQSAIPKDAPLVLNAPATAEEILRAIAIGRGQALAERPQPRLK